MITTVTLGSTSLKCDNLEKPPKRKRVVINIPGRDADIIQDLGAGLRILTITGIITGVNKDTEKLTLEGYTGTTQNYNDGEDVDINVYVDEVVIPVTGGMPNHYRFTIRLIEYLQT